MMKALKIAVVLVIVLTAVFALTAYADFGSLR